jgi:two-component system, OmpR family, sensor kinase
MFALAITLTLVGLGAFIHQRLAGALLQGVDRNLGARADALTSALAAAGSAQAPLALGGGHRFADPDEAFAQVLDPSGGILDSTPGAAAAPLLTARRAGGITRPTYLVRRGEQADDRDRLLAVPATAGGRRVIAVVGETLGDRQDVLGRLLLLYAIAGPVGLVLISAGGWLLAGAALRPVESIRRRAAELSDADRNGRLPVPRTGDEIARLASTVNDLLARLHAAVEREHRFVDEASHELRTPLAVLRAELDLALARPRNATELNATLAAAAGQTDRLIALAQDLLVLARARQRYTPLGRMPTQLATLLSAAVKPVSAEAASSGVSIEVRAEDVLVQVDPDQLERAVLNLVQNAVRHGAGAIQVQAARQGDQVLIEVSDHGPGFPSGSLNSVFEPFNRESLRASRAAARGASPTGAGLGLAIVRDAGARGCAVRVSVAGQAG